MTGQLGPGIFFESANEHRIAWTRLFLLGLFKANGGQWDPMLEMVAQAPLHALAITLLVAMVTHGMSGGWRVAVAGLAAVLGVIPFGWENTLWGFQSQFYFLSLYGVLVMWICWRHEALSGWWWAGAALGVANLFTMGGGVFPVTALGGFLWLRVITERDAQWRRRAAGALVFVAIAALGVALTPMDLNPTLKAGGFAEYLGAVTGILSWPCASHWAWCIVQAPLVLVAALYLARRVRFDSAGWFVVLAGGSFLLQALVTGYKRCHAWDQSRYSDSWMLMLIIQIAAIYYLKQAAGSSRTNHLSYISYAVAVAWGALAGYGLLEKTTQVLPPQLEAKRMGMVEMAANVRDYLRTGDAAFLQKQIPFPNAAKLKTVLDDPMIRGILPPDIYNPNPPLRAVMPPADAATLLEKGYPQDLRDPGRQAWGTYRGPGAMAAAGGKIDFPLPAGAREVDLLVAGYPGMRGNSLKARVRRGIFLIAPDVDPGMQWDLLSIELGKRAKSVEVRVSDHGDFGWLAFSAPVVSTRHLLGRAARDVTAASWWVVVAGWILMAAGALRITAWRRLRLDPRPS
jgi:hypothetical protein